MFLDKELLQGDLIGAVNSEHAALCHDARRATARKDRQWFAVVTIRRRRFIVRLQDSFRLELRAWSVASAMRRQPVFGVFIAWGDNHAILPSAGKAIERTRIENPYARRCPLDCRLQSEVEGC